VRRSRLGRRLSGGGGNATSRTPVKAAALGGCSRRRRLQRGHATNRRSPPRRRLRHRNIPRRRRKPQSLRPGGHQRNGVGWGSCRLGGRGSRRRREVVCGDGTARRDSSNGRGASGRGPPRRTRRHAAGATPTPRRLARQHGAALCSTNRDVRTEDPRKAQH
jgi:hypothetical protein